MSRGAKKRDYPRVQLKSCPLVHPDEHGRLLQSTLSKRNVARNTGGSANVEQGRFPFCSARVSKLSIVPESSYARHERHLLLRVIHLFDLRGREVPHTISPTQADGNWQVDLKLTDWAPIAVME